LFGSAGGVAKQGPVVQGDGNVRMSGSEQLPSVGQRPAVEGVCFVELVAGRQHGGQLVGDVGGLVRVWAQGEVDGGEGLAEQLLGSVVARLASSPASRARSAATAGSSTPRAVSEIARAVRAWVSAAG
jgi:hypothetical protein